MAAHLQGRISVDEYVARYIDRAGKPACEYIDGVLIPKPMAGDDHSAAQSNLVFYLRSRYNETMKIRPGLHAKLRQARFRIPDVMVIDRKHPFEGRYPGPGSPVFLCIEIKSPDDSLEQIYEKCREYHAWGVPHFWVIDPEARRLWAYDVGDAEPKRCSARLSAGNISVTAAEVLKICRIRA
jgi:Uma2 family endonuclease